MAEPLGNAALRDQIASLVTRTHHIRRAELKQPEPMLADPSHRFRNQMFITGHVRHHGQTRVDLLDRARGGVVDGVGAVERHVHDERRSPHL